MRTLVALILLLPTLTAAQVPARLAYQGRLSRASGAPPSGLITISFKIFASSTSTTELWSEQQLVALTDGYYALSLGDATPPGCSGTACTGIPAAVFDGTERFLEVSIVGDVLSPRQPMVSVPYALAAGVSTSLSGGTVSATSVNVGGATGTTISSSGLSVNGTTIINASGQIAPTAMDALKVQARVTGVCTGTSAIASIDATGSATCSTPALSSIGAGDGIVIEGSTPSPQMSAIRVPTRQTVLAGQVDAKGQASFLSAGSGLAVRLIAGGTADPVIVAFAAGFDQHGAVDHVGTIGVSLNAWSGLAANTTVYLWIDRDATSGALTYGSTTLQPTYQYGAPEGAAADQHWFDLAAFTMKRWNGLDWEKKQRVFVGECLTSASAVTPVTTYALRGEYEKDWFPVTASTNYVLNHNIGVDFPQIVSFVARNSALLLVPVDVGNSSIWNNSGGNYGAGVRFNGGTQVTLYATGNPYHDKNVRSASTAEWRIRLSRRF